jgi:hypothetical protein
MLVPSPTGEPQDPKALGAGYPMNSSPWVTLGVYLSAHPIGEGIGAEVALDHQVGLSMVSKSENPHREKTVQCLLAYSNRGVGPYRIEFER